MSAPRWRYATRDKGGKGTGHAATAEGCKEINAKLAKMCGWRETRCPCGGDDGCSHGSWLSPEGNECVACPDFLAGWDPEKQTCDESLVDGGLALRLAMALERYSPLLNWSHDGQRWHVAISLPIDQDALDGQPRRAEAVHAHLCAALALVAEALGLLEEVEP